MFKYENGMDKKEIRMVINENDPDTPIKIFEVLFQGYY